MKRTLLLVGILLLVSVGALAQTVTVTDPYGNNHLLIESDGVKWLRVDDRGVYHYAPGFNAERIINEMAALGAKQLSALSPSPPASWSYGLVIDLSMARGEAKRHAHAQQQPKAVASVAAPVSPPTDAPIPFPARAKVMIKDLDAEVEKLKKDYKSDEYDKELKALNEKYKIGEQNQKLQSLQKQYGLVLQLAVAEAGLTDEQQRTLTPAKSSSGEWQWVKVPTGPRQ